MAKIKIGANISLDATQYVSSDEVTTLTISSAGSIAVGGVSSVVGSTGSDTIKLLPNATVVDLVNPFDITSFRYNTGSTTTAVTDTIVGTSSADTINLGSSTAGMVKLNYNSGGTTTTDNITGTSGIDTITLISAGKVSYTSGGGVDVLAGSSGADTITLITGGSYSYKSGGGNDTLTGADGATGDTITLSAASSFTYIEGGTTANDSIIGFNGNDKLTLGTTTNGLSYTLTGGTDTLVGSAGADTISITAVTTTLKYSSGSNTADTLNLVAGSNSVTLNSASNVSVAAAGTGGDSVVGSTGNDTIKITATTGSFIKGGAGADTLTGTSGDVDDTFYYGLASESGKTSTTRDTINGFTVDASPATGDVLQFAGLLTGTFDSASIVAAGIGFTATGNSQVRLDGAGLLEVDYDGNATVDMSIMLTGVTAIATSDFLWS